MLEALTQLFIGQRTTDWKEEQIYTFDLDARDLPQLSGRFWLYADAEESDRFKLGKLEFPYTTDEEYRIGPGLYIDGPVGQIDRETPVFKVKKLEHQTRMEGHFSELPQAARGASWVLDKHIHEGAEVISVYKYIIHDEARGYERFCYDSVDRVEF